MAKNNQYLYLVVIGGMAPKANIELHDVRWVIGSKIEDTFESLRKNWFGSLEGLHIDTYKKIKSVDGYKINIKNIEKDKIKKNTFNNNPESKEKLWFVNLGGYESDSMQERHEFGLVVAKNPQEAKIIAKSKWLLGFKKTHKDNLSFVNMILNVDDCELIKNIDNWEIELTLENNFFEDNSSPDWYGYKRIDRI